VRHVGAAAHTIQTYGDGNLPKLGWIDMHREYWPQR
jgi:hypothetical protein